MAETRFEQLLSFLEKEPNDPFLNYAMAMEYLGKDESEKAFEILQKIAKINPDYGATYYHLAKLYLDKNDTENAEITFKKGIEITKTNKQQHLLSELQSAYNEFLFDDLI